ncbi:hypothetical protein BDV59DRAFT_200342 [Aspergillus ambiguus]|uniref:thiamine-binding protein n=1 Tax=Aspergillus ambiguus TaxID=176160 RepID=UPI003CCD6244
MEYDKTTPVPNHCIADFSLVPIGTKDVSFAKEISQVARMAKLSGLRVDIHQVGTVIEGPWARVTEVIGQAHTMLHRQGIVRIQTDIRITTRTDREQAMNEPVEKVSNLMESDG